MGGMTWLGIYITTKVHNIDYNMKKNNLKNVIFIEWMNLSIKLMSFKVGCLINIVPNKLNE